METDIFPDGAEGIDDMYFNGIGSDLQPAGDLIIFHSLVAAEVVDDLLLGRKSGEGLLQQPVVLFVKHHIIRVVDGFREIPKQSLPAINFFG